jgi:hypothetical protein
MTSFLGVSDASDASLTAVNRQTVCRAVRGMRSNRAMDEFIRCLMPNRERDMTVCIAAICDEGYDTHLPKIVFCADRLVTAGVQFESGQPKIKMLAPNCFVMTSSTDSQSSDLILENTIGRLGVGDQLRPISKIVELLGEECRKFKDLQIERDVFAKYKAAAKSIGADAKDVLHHAIEELQTYQYVLQCEFLLIGFDTPSEPHIYKIDQDGAYSLCDSTGFAAVGSGGWLAFLEMTKYAYSVHVGLNTAIPRVYFAKKVAERAAGVGRLTDIYSLAYIEKVKSYQVLGNTQEFIEEIEQTYQAIRKYEEGQVVSIATALARYWDAKGNVKIDNQISPSPSASE